ncbi:unnamed protein product [Leuciscus chuanchicus]
MDYMCSHSVSFLTSVQEITSNPKLQGKNKEPREGGVFPSAHQVSSLQFERGFISSLHGHQTSVENTGQPFNTRLPWADRQKLSMRPVRFPERTDIPNVFPAGSEVGVESHTTKRFPILALNPEARHTQEPSEQNREPADTHPGGS